MNTMQSIHIAKTKSQPAKPRVAVFMGKTERKKYKRAVWNSMSREQQMPIRKLCEQQGINPATKQTSAETRIAALEA